MKFLFLILLFPTVCIAKQKNQDRVNYLGSFVGHENMELIDFVKEISVYMKDYTYNTNYEVCGSIAFREESSQYSIKLYTSNMPNACIIEHNSIDGFNLINQTIHTHPNTGNVIRLTREQSKWMKDNVGVFVGKITMKLGFSKNDYNLGNGWLIQNNNIYYQEGRQIFKGRVPVFSNLEIIN